jgi:hypothetical protein
VTRVVALRVNGEWRPIEAAAQARLLDGLRDDRERTLRRPGLACARPALTPGRIVAALDNPT